MAVAASEIPDVVEAAPNWRPNSLSVLVLLAGLVLTGALAWITVSIHDHNEDRLLNLELKQAASVVTAAVPSIQIPLTSAAELAAATGGSAQQFQTYMKSFVGHAGPFVGASLWRLSPGQASEVAAVGTAPEPAASASITAFLTKARNASTFAVANMLNRSLPTIAYAAAALSATTPWVVYAERQLPENRRLKVTQNSAFSQLNYALYLGPSTKPGNLLEASSNEFPLRGNLATASVPFGDSAITVVATPDQELGGSLLARLPWIVALAGAGLSLAAAVLADYLVRRRRQAEWLAFENRRMYSEQRSIAEVLQQALLPQALPEVAGVETAIRYVAGSEGTDVGGDWYDVIPLDDDHFIFVLGDVSGRGVEAATIMARLHFAIRAYAIQGDGPAAILGKLGRFLDIDRDQSFATILCALVDVPGHAVTLVNAGHPPLLLLQGETGDFVRTTVFPPVGVDLTTVYEATDFVVPDHATLMAFTDGLIERRDESIDIGLERLRTITTEHPMGLDDLLSKILTESSSAEYHDDTAILAVRWKN
jgi:Stage II sporulation protein E (SpoIIE)